MCLSEEGVFVFDAGTEVTDAELPHLGISGKSGCLNGCGVTRLLCSQSAFMEISSLVIKQIHAIYNLLQLRKIDGVAAISK